MKIDLAEIRAKHGMSIEDMSEYFECSASLIAQIESCKIPFPVKFAEKLTALLFPEFSSPESKPAHQRYIMYTDGGCQNNPGGIGGYGVVILDENGNKLTELSSGYLSTTNNRMEIMAVLKGLQSLQKNSYVTVYSDSQYVVKTANGEYAIHKNMDLWDEIRHEMNCRNVEFIWVKGHNGDKYNERCDQLATKAQGLPHGDLLNDEGYSGSW